MVAEGFELCDQARVSLSGSRRRVSGPSPGSRTATAITSLPTPTAAHRSQNLHASLPAPAPTKQIAILAACAAANTDTLLGERLRRLASRPGGGGRKKAGCAVGRSILVLVRHLLNDRAARYRDLDPAGTPGPPTTAARPATPSASSRPSTATSSSPSGRTPPDPGASNNRIAVTASPGRASHGTISSCPEPRSRERAEVVISWSDHHSFSDRLPGPVPADMRGSVCAAVVLSHAVEQIGVTASCRLRKPRGAGNPKNE